MMHDRTFFFLVMAALVGVLSGPLAAQQSHLDQGTFIDGLATRNMSELLGHLVETEPARDEVFNRQIEIAQQVMRANDPGLSRAQKVDAIRAQITATRRLIADHTDHEQRPVWQTDLAQRYFVGQLAFVGNYAADFHEFGVCTAEQRQMIESHMADVFIALAQADVRFRQLEDALSRDDDRRRELTNSGQWARMFDVYWANTTQYYLAMAAYHTALLDDSHPYFQNLGDTRVPLQRTDIAEERRRLFGLAIESIESLLNPNNDYLGETARLAALSLMGRAQMQRGEYDAALQTLDRVIDARRTEMREDLHAQLGRAMAMHRAGRHNAAAELLLTLDRHPLAQEQSFNRLLVKDQLHRMLLDRASRVPQAQQASAIAEAYDPYFDLLNAMRRSDNPQVVAEAAGFEQYIYQRWQDNRDPSIPTSELPAAVVMGIGTALQNDGQRLARDAEDAARAGRQGDARPLRAEAIAKLREAVELLEPLLERENLLDAVRARALFNAAMANYWQDRFDVGNILRASRQWTQLADELPDQPISERAIELAVGELWRVYSVSPGAPGYEQAFQQALNVLFSKYPSISFADDFRLSYVSDVLIPTGRYEEGYRIAQGVPMQHPTYFEARREMLYCMLEVYLAMDSGRERDAFRRQLLELGEQLLDESESVMQQYPAEQLPVAVASLTSAEASDEMQRLGTAMNAAGHTRVILAQLNAEDGHVDEALAFLETFETKFGADPELAREGVGRRIGILIAANRVPEAGQEAERMVEVFADDAVDTVNQVVDSLERQIDQLRRQLHTQRGVAQRAALEQRIDAMTQVLVTLTDHLMRWAGRQNLDTQEMLPYRLVRVKALCMAGKGEEAVEQATILHEAFPRDAMVIHYMGEALFTRGMDRNSREDLTIAVARHFDVLIAGLDESSPFFWHAWMRRLQVMDHLNHQVHEIPVRVNGLLRTDPGLGGEPYRTTLLNLRDKHM